jgi:hypothetical protein
MHKLPVIKAKDMYGLLIQYGNVLIPPREFYTDKTKRFIVVKMDDEGTGDDD